MIESKYMIIIGVVLCLLVLYYFYDEMSNMKKLIEPTYQKSMALEVKVNDLEKKTISLINTNRALKKRGDNTPPLSITYNSMDFEKKNHPSVKYGDLSETEANELLKKIKDAHPNIINEKPKISPVKQKTISNPDNELLSISYLYPSVKKGRNESDEYQQILAGLENSDLQNSSTGFMVPAISEAPSSLDSDIIRYVSESVRHLDAPSAESNLSELPVKRPVNKKFSSNVLNKINIDPKKNFKSLKK